MERNNDAYESTLCFTRSLQLEISGCPHKSSSSVRPLVQLSNKVCEREKSFSPLKQLTRFELKNEREESLFFNCFTCVRFLVNDHVNHVHRLLRRFYFIEFQGSFSQIYQRPVDLMEFVVKQNHSKRSHQSTTVIGQSICPSFICATYTYAK